MRGDGAVGAPEGSPDEGVAWHFGDPFGEQRAAARAAVVVDRSHRGVIEIDGEERLSWLHTISSQHLLDLADRWSAEDLNLDLNGRVEDHFVVTDVDQIAWVDTEGTRADALADFLSKMIFWAKVEVAPRPDMAVLSLVGPDIMTGPIAELLDLGANPQVYQAGDLPEIHHDEEPLGFWRIMPPTGEGRRTPTIDLVIPEYLVETWWDELVSAGARPAGTWAYEAMRVAAVRPRLGLDTDDRAIPHELGWIGGVAEQGAVHLDKGCYRGQETVARVHNLGKPPRRLALVHLDGSADNRPQPGETVTADGRAVGRLGSVVDHFEFGPIGLALVKRTIPVDTALVIRGVDASIDPDSLTDSEHEQAGRAAIDKLRGR
nr:folate-binding protein [Gordonia jinhuaensis]